MVLPDEAAYRAEVDARLAAGGAVYLARYLPGLAGAYYLRSAGPLVEVSREPRIDLPAEVVRAEQVIGPLRLLGYAIEPVAAFDPRAAGLEFYWTLDRALAEGEPSPVIYLRWTAGGAVSDPVVAGHPVNNTYPVNAWHAGEIVVDEHSLPLPELACAESACEGEIQVAIAPRFTPVAELDWQTVTTAAVPQQPGPVGAPRRASFDGFALDGIDFPTVARPRTPLSLRYSGQGTGESLTFLVVPPHAVNSLVIPTDRAPVGGVAAEPSVTYAIAVEPAVETGPQVLIAYTADEGGAVCGWLQRPATGCVVAEIDLRGAALPQGAANFDDQIALLDVALGAEELTLGGQLPVTLTWQGLAEMSADYTVFVQVLDPTDRIVGQVDAWPVQGTFPTSAWTPGEAVRDTYLVQLAADLPPGNYRLHVGLYLLATLERLSVLDTGGAAVDDKVEVGGLVVR